MTQTDKTREKLIASIRKTKAPESGSEPAAAAPKPEAAAEPARKPAGAAQPKRARPRKSPSAAAASETPAPLPAEPANEAPAGDIYSIGRLRWPD